ncbi:VCBS domain-containing protein, partial [Escherichia coli]|uniref:VCBS domain-containing protein n=1 Tax=Escherichia coli TaxID=562 RepID=UPI0011308E30
TTGQSRTIEMRADGEIHLEDGVDTQWGGLMADSTGQQQYRVSTLSKSGNGTLEMNDSGTETSAVRVEDGTLKAEAENNISLLYTSDAASDENKVTCGRH